MRRRIAPALASGSASDVQQPEDRSNVFAAANARWLYALAVALFAAGCASGPDPAEEPAPPDLVPFSKQAAGGLPSRGWEPWTFSAFKRPTRYRLEDKDGHVVLSAHAENAASGLVHRVRYDLQRFPILEWRWRVDELIPAANNARAGTEDSPVRIVVAFAGDIAKLRPMERLTHHKFRLITRQDLPYATLMYIWENQAPIGTVIENPHTSRIRMIVADSGSQRVGQWSERRVNLHEDYRRAFGEAPPPVQWIGLMTDSDNTGTTIRAWYGDLRIRPAD